MDGSLADGYVAAVSVVQERNKIFGDICQMALRDIPILVFCDSILRLSFARYKSESVYHIGLADILLFQPAHMDLLLPFILQVYGSDVGSGYSCLPVAVSAGDRSAAGGMPLLWRSAQR